MNVLRRLVLLACLVLPALGLADTRATFDLASDALGSSRTITVSLPESYYRQSGYSYPLLVLLDGETNLDYTESVSRYLSENGLAPDLVIAAIHAGQTRAQDYLPINPQTGSTKDAGAESFLQFIERDLITALRSKYRIAPLKLLSGHSYGGIFVTYALLNEPSLFEGYMTQSPYYGPGLGGRLVENLGAFIANPDSTVPFFYANLGDEPMLALQFSALKNHIEKSPPGNWFAVDFPGEGHMSTRMSGQYQALKKFFGTRWSYPQDKLVSGTYADLADHLGKLSRTFGYDVLLPDSIYQSAVGLFLQKQDAASAQQTAAAYVGQYDQSATAHLVAAQVYAASDDPVEARRYASRALSLDDESRVKLSTPQRLALHKLLGDSR